jgi:thiol-disulfide isomerase/thioredoxin
MKLKVIVLCIFINSLFTAKASQFLLYGKINGLNNIPVELSWWISKKNKSYQVKYSKLIQNKKFHIRGNLNEPVKAELKISDKIFELFIEPKTMQLDILDFKNNKYKLIGSSSQNDKINFEKKLLPYQIEINQLTEMSLKYKSQIKLLNNNKLENSMFEVNCNIISKKIDSLYNLKLKNGISWIKSNPNSFYSILSDFLLIGVSNATISVDSARLYFNNLSKNVKESDGGFFLNNYISTKENIQIGKIAPNFSSFDLNGNPIILSSFRDENYVLLDFWASWCSPCIKGIPHIIDLNEKFVEMGLKIICISSDWIRQDWINAINKYKINNITQILAVNDLDKASQGYHYDYDIQSIYPTDGIPKYILIDKSGKIIGKWEGYSEENEKDMNNLIEKILQEEK